MQNAEEQIKKIIFKDEWAQLQSPHSKIGTELNIIKKEYYGRNPQQQFQVWQFPVRIHRAQHSCLIRGDYSVRTQAIKINKRKKWYAGKRPALFSLGEPWVCDNVQAL